MTEPENQNEPRKKLSRVGWEILESVAIAVILAILIRVFLFEPFFIPSWSMSPTMVPGDKIIVSKLNYRFTDPKRGDIVVFKYPLNPQKDYVKRIIGLPGETIQVIDNKVFVNNQQLEENYLAEGLIYADFGPVEIPLNNYFMMGDNRPDSQDSRYWGTLDRDLMVGKAVVIFWPPGRARTF